MKVADGESMKFKIILVLLSVLILSFILGNFINIYKPLKIALKENDLSKKKYILCKVTRVTGFDWLLIKDEYGNDTSEYINIIGPSPFNTFKLSYNFETAGNTFIFYVKEKNIVHYEEMRENGIEYVITGWDILYPVKHLNMRIFDFLFNSKYITEFDLLTVRVSA
jgi:hypothetical protein